MNILDFVFSKKPYTIKRQPLLGFKFLVGDKVIYKGKIGLYGSLSHIFGRFIQPGDILTISDYCYNPYQVGELREKSLYSFKEDIDRKPNYLYVEENFELVKD